MSSTTTDKLIPGTQTGANAASAVETRAGSASAAEIAMKISPDDLAALPSDLRQRLQSGAAVDGEIVKLPTQPGDAKDKARLALRIGQTLIPIAQGKEAVKTGAVAVKLAQQEKLIELLLLRQASQAGAAPQAPLTPTQQSALSQQAQAEATLKLLLKIIGREDLPTQLLKEFLANLSAPNLKGDDPSAPRALLPEEALFTKELLKELGLTEKLLGKILIAATLDPLSKIFSGASETTGRFSLPFIDRFVEDWLKQLALPSDAAHSGSSDSGGSAQQTKALGALRQLFDQLAGNALGGAWDEKTLSIALESSFKMNQRIVHKLTQVTAIIAEETIYQTFSRTLEQGAESLKDLLPKLPSEFAQHLDSLKETLLNTQAEKQTGALRERIGALLSDLEKLGLPDVGFEQQAGSESGVVLDEGAVRTLKIIRAQASVILTYLTALDAPEINQLPGKDSSSPRGVLEAFKEMLEVPGFKPLTKALLKLTESEGHELSAQERRFIALTTDLVRSLTRGEATLDEADQAEARGALLKNAYQRLKNLLLDAPETRATSRANPYELHGHEAARFAQGLVATQEVLQLLNPIALSKGEGAFVVVPLLFPGFLSQLQLSLYPESKHFEQQQDGEDGEDGSKKAPLGFERIALRFALPNLGSVGLDLALRERELLLELNLEDSRVAKFVEQRMPQLNDKLTALGYAATHLRVAANQVKSAKPDWVESLFGGARAVA